MTQQLKDMAITRVSLVDKGANARRLAVLKRDEEGSMGDQVAAAIAKVEGDADTKAGVAGFLRKIADAVFGAPAPVKKVATFAEIIAGQDLQDALYDSWYTLQDALWAAIYATDDAGVDQSIEAKQALVGQDLDEFKAYLLAAMASGIQKRDASPAELAKRQLAAIVAKAGRKISGDRLGRLQTAAEALNGVLSEVVEATEAGDDAQEESVDTAEIVGAVTEAVTKAQAPLVERIEKLEAAAPKPAVVEKKTEVEGDDDEVTLEGIGKAVMAIGDRVEAIEKARGQRASVAGQDGGEPVKKSRFAGIF